MNRGRMTLSVIALAPLDQFPDLLAALATDLAEELRASLPPHDLTALAADLAVEAGAMPLLGRLTPLLAQLTVAFGAERLLPGLAAHAAGFPDRHVPTSLGHLSHHLSMPVSAWDPPPRRTSGESSRACLPNRLFTQPRSLANLARAPTFTDVCTRSEEHTSELQSLTK